MPNSRIIGVDPSFKNFGISVFDYQDQKLSLIHTGLIQTSKSKSKKKSVSDDRFERARIISLQLDKIINDFGIDLCITEIPTGSQSATAAISAGVSVGILSSIKTEIITLKPLDVKFYSVGDKYADKKDIINWAFGLYPDNKWLKSKKPNEMNIKAGDYYLTNSNEHIADSIAVVHAAKKMNKI